MSIFRRKPVLDRRLSKVGKRVAGIPANDLPMWADQAINDTGRALTSWRRRGDVADLEDALLGAEALATILHEVRRRA